MNEVARACYAIREVILMTGWSHSRVFKLIASKKLESFKDGKRRFVTRAALDKCFADMVKETNRNENLPSKKIPNALAEALGSKKPKRAARGGAR